MDHTRPGLVFIAPFLGGLLATLLAIGALNALVDPLWFSGGNRITGVNYLFNERVAKLNRLRRSGPTSYDCLVLGSSRVISLHERDFVGERCFNLGLNGAATPEVIAYARAAAAMGLAPRHVYIGVEDFNFVDKRETARPSTTVAASPSSTWQALFSADVAVFSLATLLGISPDAFYWYNARYELQRFPQPAWVPQVEQKPPMACRRERIALYRELRTLYPAARLVGFAPAVAPWHRFEEAYLRGALDCSLEAFHAIAQDLDGFIDFSIPSAITLDLRNTHDGSHYSPEANAALIAELQGRGSGLGIDVKASRYADYRAAVYARFGDFAERQGLLRFWREAPSPLR